MNEQAENSTDKVRESVAGNDVEVAEPGRPGKAREQRDTNPLRPLIEQMKPEIAKVLPQHMSPERLVRIATTVARKNPQLMRSTPESFLGALMTCAQLGLEPGVLDQAYLIPFRNSNTGQFEVQLIIGYKGLIDLARRSGHIESVIAREVHEKDSFVFEYGLNDKLEHRPLLDDDPGPVIAYYAVAKYVGGGHAFIVMTPKEIAKFRARSRSKDSGPWVTDEDAMSKKTVTRQLMKWVPMSIELATAVAQDENVREVSTADDVELPLDDADDTDADIVEGEVVA